MIIFCPYCSGSMIGIGITNAFGCIKCKCTFAIKIDIKQVTGPSEWRDDLRQLSQSNSDTESRAEELPDGSSVGTISSG